MIRTHMIFDEQVLIGADPKILIPVTSIVFEADKANHTSVCASGEILLLSFSVSHGVGMLSQLCELKFNLVNWRGIKKNSTKGLITNFFLMTF